MFNPVQPHQMLPSPSHQHFSPPRQHQQNTHLMLPSTSQPHFSPVPQSMNHTGGTASYPQQTMGLQPGMHPFPPEPAHYSSANHGGGTLMNHPTYGQQQQQQQQQRMVTGQEVPQSAVDSLGGEIEYDEDGNQYLVKYVEVPVVEEVLKHVPVQQVVEVEKRIPKYETEWVERVIEVPHIEYIDRHVEVPQIEEVLTHIPRKEIVDLPREVITQVPKVEIVMVEKTVEVPGPIVEVPRPYAVERQIPVPRVIDQRVPIVVAQVVQPMITGQSGETREVEVVRFEPKFHVVDVPVGKAIPATLINCGIINENCRVVDVPACHFNTLLRHLNPHLADNAEKSAYLPYLPDPSGNVTFVEGLLSSRGPVAVPMPMLNSPLPAVNGVNINTPIVPYSNNNETLAARQKSSPDRNKLKHIDPHNGAVQSTLAWTGPPQTSPWPNENIAVSGNSASPFGTRGMGAAMPMLPIPPAVMNRASETKRHSRTTRSRPLMTEDVMRQRRRSVAGDHGRRSKH